MSPNAQRMLPETNQIRKSRWKCGPRIVIDEYDKSKFEWTNNPESIDRADSIRTVHTHTLSASDYGLV